MSKKVLARVISQEGHCAAGMKAGDQILFDWDKNEIVGRICLHALYSVLPKVYALAHGLTLLSLRMRMETALLVMHVQMVIILQYSN